MANDKHSTPGKQTDPMENKEDVAQSNDNKIDEDFKGFPHAPASKELIKPTSPQEKKTAAVGVTDGEKKDKDEKEVDEQNSDESADAFTATEQVKE